MKVGNHYKVGKYWEKINNLEVLHPSTRLAARSRMTGMLYEEQFDVAAQVTENHWNIEFTSRFKNAAINTYTTLKKSIIKTALLSSADILVTGDKRDLLPLKSFEHVIIESPSALLVRLGY